MKLKEIIFTHSSKMQDFASNSDSWNFVPYS